MKRPNSLKKILPCTLPILLLILACSGLTPGIDPEECLQASNSPSAEDEAYALAYADGVFSPEDWDKTHQVRDERVTVTWRSKTDTSLAHMEYVVFPCGRDKATIDAYFSQENFEQVIFSAYEDLEIGRSCQKSTTPLLHEFVATSAGINYDVRFWIDLDQADDRLLDIFIALPVGNEDTLNSYGQALFPSLPAC